MSQDEILNDLASESGIVPDFYDLSGQLKPTSLETKRALLAANGFEIDNGSMIKDALDEIREKQQGRILPQEIICISRQPLNLKINQSVKWHLLIEGSTGQAFEGKSDDTITIPDVQPGIHELHIVSDAHHEIVRLIAAPEKAPSVFSKTGQHKLWGVNLALYGLNKSDVPGIGNYHDLANTASALAANGAGFLGINPVHAMGWNSPEVFSPYSPSHRGFLNTSHIAIDQIEPKSDSTKALLNAWLSSYSGQTSRLVDYEDHQKHHRLILSALYQDFLEIGSPEQKKELKKFILEAGEPAKRVALFDSLGETYGANWQNWPSEISSHIDVSGSLNDRVSFHCWLQWHAENQLRSAQTKASNSGMGLGLYLDLAVGARQNGAEAWAESDAIAQGVSIGAPPDHLSPAGQNWGLAAYSPRKLAATNYRAFRDILSRNMRRCGVLRIDHILGINRSFWLPEDGSPGGYIRHNFDALLAIIRLEAARNQTVVIGEDLGLVPDGFRDALSNSGIYSYSVLQYEKNHEGNFKSLSDLSSQSLACFGTHDTPTVKGFASGEDISWWEKLNWIDHDNAYQVRQNRNHEVAELTQMISQSETVEDTGTQDTHGTFNSLIHRSLALSPVAMVAVQFDDIEGNVDAQNLPGTIDEHPNWRRLYKIPIGEIGVHPNLQHFSSIMADSGRESLTKKKDKTA